MFNSMVYVVSIYQCFRSKFNSIIVHNLSSPEKFNALNKRIKFFDDDDK